MEWILRKMSGKKQHKITLNFGFWQVLSCSVCVRAGVYNANVSPFIYAWFPLPFSLGFLLSFFIADWVATAKWKAIQTQPKTINLTYIEEWRWRARAVCVFITHSQRRETEKHKQTCVRTYCIYQTIPFECNKNEIANAYGAYNLCHLSLLYTQYFLSIYDSLRYKIESNKRSGKQQFSILVSVKMKGETRRKKNNNNISDILTTTHRIVSGRTHSHIMEGE